MKGCFPSGQAQEAATPKRPEGAETPSMSLDLPRDSFAYLVDRHVAEQAGKQDSIYCRQAALHTVSLIPACVLNA